MKKNEFLQELKRLIQKIPEHDQAEILQDLEEYFTDGMLDGKTEEAITTALGSPKALARDLLAAHHLEKAETTISSGNVFRAMWAVLGLGFFNLIFVLGPFVGLVGVLIGGWAASAGFIAAPLLVLVNYFLYPDTFEWFDVFASSAFCGLGLFGAMGMYTVTKFLQSGFLSYLKFNMRLVKGGLRHAE
ncbi:hypothetical protein OXB_3568 [Bacillus sp. OxB-1]|uniref:DUF1700 domain-containing protein n=1 Tax=Bacillus sp. (strain OxB-1) TaxID=98228 RepID=UPI0005823111|nr:DUF1700 domain-containing protein [Bacillus sp. OxB-1]BAQ12037.1 hypothetical protein OXB_3568 [Bacillus sp. OxB-1]